MGRKKQYQYEDVLNKGLEVFWHYGYENLTVDDLVKYTGLNRDSLYKSFGNKQQFYIKVMHHYIDTIFTLGPGRYFQTHQGLEAIHLFINAAIDAIDNKGCFISNTDASYLAYPREIQIIVDEYKQRLKQIFNKNLRYENKELATEQNTLILLAFFGGAIAIQKGNNQAQELKQALEKLIQHIKQCP